MNTVSCLDIWPRIGLLLRITLPHLEVASSWTCNDKTQPHPTALRTCLRSTASMAAIASSSSSFGLGNSAMILRVPCSRRYVGCGPPVCSHVRLVWHTEVKARRRFSGLRTFMAALYLGSSCGGGREWEECEVWAREDRRAAVGMLDVDSVRPKQRQHQLPLHPTLPTRIQPIQHPTPAVTCRSHPAPPCAPPHRQHHELGVVVRHAAQHLDHGLEEVDVEHGLGQLDVTKVARAVEHAVAVGGALRREEARPGGGGQLPCIVQHQIGTRSEERRVGKEWRARGSDEQ